MRRAVAVAALCACVTPTANPQGRPLDWPTFGGDARRTGWQRSDTRITKENIKDFQLVLKRKFDKNSGQRSLTPPVIIGLLISYKGFKELGFVAGSGGGLWSIDVDLDRMFWQKQLPSVPAKAGAAKSPFCSDGLPAMPALTPPVTFGGRRPAAPKPVTPPGTPVSPGQAATAAARQTALPARLGGGGFGGPRPVYLVTGDGKLHMFNTSDGSDQFPPLNFLPAGSKPLTLTLDNNVMYTTTDGNCGSAPSAVWALDLATEEPKPVSVSLNGARPGGLSGLAVGNDGTVYVQAGPKLLALGSRDLKPKGEVVLAEKATSETSVTTPVVFEFKGHDFIVSTGGDGRLHLLDSHALQAPAAKTAQITSAGGSIFGGISSWEDSDGIRWIAAPVWGALNSELKAAATNGPTPNGAIVTFKVEDQGGKPVLTPGWISRDMSSPQPPVITSGAVFALSSGGSRATMYAFDSATGKEMYSTGNQVGAPANLTGMTIANGRVFFTTTDGTLYGFGVYLER